MHKRPQQVVMVLFVDAVKGSGLSMRRHACRLLEACSKTSTKTVSSTNLLLLAASDLQDTTISGEDGTNRACTSVENLDAPWYVNLMHTYRVAKTAHAH